MIEPTEISSEDTQRVMELSHHLDDLFKDEKWQEALDAINQVLVIYQCAFLYGARADALANLGRYDESLEFYNIAINLAKETGDFEEIAAAHNGMGNALKHLGMAEENPEEARKLYDESIIAYSRAIELTPDDAGFLCNKGKVLQIIGDERSALECFNQAYELIESGRAQEEEGENAIFIENTLSQDREILLKKLIELQEANIRSEELLSALDPDDPRTQEALEDLAEIKHETSGVISAYATSDDSKKSIEESARQAQEVNVLLQKVAKLESRLDQHDTDITDIKVSQEQMSAILSKLQIEEASARKEISLFLNKLNAAVTGAVPEQIAQDPYKNAFYNSLQRDLNATYIAAMSVQTEIVANSKKSPLLGKMGNILSIAGEYIPTLGGGVILLGTILSAVDQRQQDAMVKKFAAMANSVSQMEVVTSHIAQMLTQDGFTGLLGGDDRSFNKKISSYLLSFLQEVSGAKNTKAAASNVGIDMIQKMGVSVAESSIKEQSSRSKISWLKSKISVSKKKAAAEQEKEEVKTSYSTDESQGDKDAHMLSAMIISKIYKGEISAGGSPDNIAKSAACAIFGHFDLSAGIIESLLSVSPTQIALMPAAAAVVDAETTEDAIAKDILTRIERQVSPTEEFRNAFMESMISRLKTITSQNDIKFIESLQLSSDFAEMFKAQAAEIFITKLKEDKSVIPNLKVMKAIFKEIETELRDEGQFKSIDNQILVWNAFLEYDNPFLDHPELLQSAQDLGIDTLKLINIGEKSPAFAQGILNGVETHGAEFVLRSVFGGAGDGVPMTFDSSLDTTVVAGDVVESGCL